MDVFQKLLDKYRGMAEFEGVDIVRFDQKGRFEDAPIHKACYNGWLEDVELMIKHGVDINVRGDIGNTPLHEAVMSGNVDLVVMLVFNGADKFVKNDYGDEPIDYAPANKAADLRDVLM